MTKPPLHILLCAPRGFCAGVIRAIDAVEQALRIYGPPVYVRHEIVHNKYVVESLKKKGAIFVEELDEIPTTSAPVIFSAHGAEGHSARGVVTGTVRHRRHLSAGHQGASRGGTASSARPQDHPGRARRTSGGGWHARAIAGRCGHPGREHNRRASACRRTRARTRGPAAGLRHPDDPLGRRHAGHRRGAEAAFSPISPDRIARTSATPPPTPGGGQAHRAECRCDAGGRFCQFVELPAPQGGVGAGRLPGQPTGAAGERHRLDSPGPDPHHRHHGRRFRAGGAGRGDHRCLRRAVLDRGRDRGDGDRDDVLPAAARAARAGSSRFRH